MKTTIGGNRLGSGKKNTVELKNYERSTHDLSYIWRSTMATGTLTPFLVEVALPGDTFDIDLECDIKTHPTVGPLFGSFKVQIDVFQCPVRLYQGALHNNRIGIGMKMSNIKLPQIEIAANDVDRTKLTDNAQINPSSLISYLNIRGIGTAEVAGQTKTRQFNGIPYLAYWDIYKNYYANKQEEIGAMMHTDVVAVNKNISGVTVFLDNGNITEPLLLNGTQAITLDTSAKMTVTSTGTQTKPENIILITPTGTISALDYWEDYIVESATIQIFGNRRWQQSEQLMGWRYIQPEDIRTTLKVTTFPLANIDTMRDKILAQPIATPLVINAATNLAPYHLPFQINGNGNALKNTMEGLALKTYQNDLFNNWMQTAWIDGTNGISQVTAVSTASGSFTIDTLNLSKKVYDMLNRIAISGGSYEDWIESVYTNDTLRKAESPMYMGGLSKELVFQEVISNSASQTDNGTQPLGELGGRGVMSGKHKGGKITIKVDEPSYIMGIISLTPRIDYSQGNKWDCNLKTMDDFHKPALDEIGFQDLITDQMAWWDTRIGSTGNIIFRSVGKQPAWMNYMTNVNQTRGNFAIEDNEMFMTLNRRYDGILEARISDLTTYVDPAKYNNIFAQTSLDAQNYWTQIGVNMTARRKMSAKIMPNL